MRRVLYLVTTVVVLISLLWVLPPAPVQADTSWTFNFTDGDHEGWFYDDAFEQQGGEWTEWFITAEDERAGDGWAAGYSGWHYGNQFTMAYDLGEDIGISKVSLYRFGPVEALGRYFRVAIYNESMDIVYMHDTGITGSGESTIYEYHPDYPTGYWTGRYVVIHCHAEWTHWADWVQFTVEGEWSPPTESEESPLQLLRLLRQADEANVWPQYSLVQPVLEDSTTGLYDVIAVSQNAGAFVHAIAPGYVEAITSVSTDDCEETATIIDVENSANAIAAFVQAALEFDYLGAWAEYIALITSESSKTICTIDLEGQEDEIYNFFSGMIGFAADDLFLVQINEPETDTDFYYLALHADELILEGQTIVAGCALGYTLPVFSPTLGGDFANEVARVFFGEFGEQHSAAFVWAKNGENGADISILPYMVIYPTHDEACWWTAGREQCINANPQFMSYLSPGGWLAVHHWFYLNEAGLLTPDVHPAGEDRGLILVANGDNDAVQGIVMPPGETYSVFVQAFVISPPDAGGDPHILINLGETEHDITITTGITYEWSSSEQVYTPDLSADVYTLSVEIKPGQAGAEVLVNRVCVSTSQLAAAVGEECLFIDWGFNDPDAWDLAGGAVISGSTLQLPEDATASQTISLLADDYVLEIVMRAMPEKPPPEAGYYAELDWIYEDGEVEKGSGTVDTDWYLLWETLKDEWVLSGSVTDGTFTFTGGASQNVAQIDSVCLIPDTLPTAPRSMCDPCPITLVGDLVSDTPELFFWSICEVQNIYYCDAEPILLDIEKDLTEAVRGIGFLGRWLGAAMTGLGKFLASMAYFNAGYLNNTALMTAEAIAWQRGGSTTIIEDTPLGFWDVLGLLITGITDTIISALETLRDIVAALLDFLTPIAGALLDAIVAAVSLIGNVIDIALGTVDIIRLFFFTLIDAINNAEPQTIPGAPDCSAMEEGEWYCFGFYVLDNTIFSGPAAYLIPLMLGAAALNLFIWAIERFKSAFAQT